MMPSTLENKNVTQLGLRSTVRLLFFEQYHVLVVSIPVFSPTTEVLGSVPTRHVMLLVWVSSKHLRFPL